MTMAQDEGRELGWNDEISQDGPEFVTLPDGEYPFTVELWTRARHGGSEKLPPCNKAVIKIKVIGGDKGNTTVFHNLFMHSKCEGMLSEFFKGIGARKHGERMVMDWNKVPGASGRCKLGTRVYKDKTYNEIKGFIDPAKIQAAATGDTPDEEIPF